MLEANERELFTLGFLANDLASPQAAISSILRGWNPDDLLTRPFADVVDLVIARLSLDCPRLLLDDAWMPDLEEVDRQFEDFGRRHTRRATRVVLVIPFEGDERIFTLRPDTGTTVPPRVYRLSNNEIRLAIDDPPPGPGEADAAFERQIADIEKHLGWARAQIEAFNGQVRDHAPGMVEARRQQLLADRNLQANMRYPIRRRSDANTYSVPIKRAVVRPRSTRPLDATQGFEPEPTMADQDYQAALTVLRNQRNALERTPSLAAKHGEEDIRDLLLLGLNAQFEGAAAGELFNGAGKTDITIRVDDRNIFIGECKIWDGPQTMDEALGQLFSYLVWRDTKAAILLFIRNVDVTAVINKAIDKIEEHPYYKRTRETPGDDQYEFTMHAKDDPAREIHLTFIPFALRGAI
jgi:hypothetical protein